MQSLFGRAVSRTFLTGHSFGDSKIALNKNSAILTENIRIAKTFNLHFESIRFSSTIRLALPSNISYNKEQNFTNKFSNHPSIIKIKQKFKLNKKLSF